jgi:hypothetical protein
MIEIKLNASDILPKLKGDLEREIKAHIEKSLKNKLETGEINHIYLGPKEAIAVAKSDVFQCALLGLIRAEIHEETRYLQDEIENLKQEIRKDKKFIEYLREQNANRY